MIKNAIHIYKNTPIKVFTLRWLSTENLKNRSDEELAYLFDLYKKITENLYQVFREEKINFRVAGDITQLPEKLQKFLTEKMEEYSFDSDRVFVLAINYGGQDEILRAVEQLKNSWEEVNKENLEKYMDFWGLPPVDLVIRTKQKLAKRLSGFMLWWIGYAQLYFTDLYSPELTVEEFEKAIAWRRTTLKTQNFGK